MNQGGNGSDESSGSTGNNSHSKPPLYGRVPRLRFSNNLDAAVKFEIEHGHTLDPGMDNKKLRRTISNRLAASKARVKQKDYTSELLSKIEELQMVNEAMRTEVKVHQDYQSSIGDENKSLLQRIEMCAERLKLGEEITNLRTAEIARLMKSDAKNEVETSLDYDDDDFWADLDNLGTSSVDQFDLDELK